MTLLGWTEEALVWTSFASAMVFVAFCFVVLKNVSFVEAIRAIRSPGASATSGRDGGAWAPRWSLRRRCGSDTTW